MEEALHGSDHQSLPQTPAIDLPPPKPDAIADDATRTTDEKLLAWGWEDAYEKPLSTNADQIFSAVDSNCETTRHGTSPKSSEEQTIVPSLVPASYAYQQAFRTFLDVRLPRHSPLSAKDTASRKKLSLNIIPWLMQYIWEHDASATLYPFPNDSSKNKKEDTAEKKHVMLPPITSGSSSTILPTSIQRVGKYLANFWIYPSGANGTCRLYLHHSKEISVLLTHLNSQQGYFYFSMSQIQAANVVRTAWLKGTTASTNCNDLATTILNTPGFQERPDVKLVLRQEPVKLYYSENLTPEHHVHAVHVYTAKEHHKFVLDALTKLYNQTPSNDDKEDFPVALPTYGKYYTMPDSTSPIAEPLTRQNVVDQGRQQKAALKHTTINAKDLHGIIPYEGSVHLCPQLLVKMIAKDDVSGVLSVDRHPLRAFTYIFSFQEKYETLAMAAIDCIIANLTAESSGLKVPPVKQDAAPVATTPTTTASFFLVPSAVLRRQARKTKKISGGN